MLLCFLLSDMIACTVAGVNLLNMSFLLNESDLSRVDVDTNFYGAGEYFS